MNWLALSTYMDLEATEQERFMFMQMLGLVKLEFEDRKNYAGVTNYPDHPSIETRTYHRRVEKFRRKIQELLNS